jgi:nicotinate-nucleotide pyrophosphorylase (carboxylating)
MSMQISEALSADIRRVVDVVLAEDIGSGDLTAALVPDDATVEAGILCREPMVLAGRPWVDALFARLDPGIRIDWRCADGDRVPADTTICRISGPARPILSGERGALNLLQTLAATATTTSRYVDAVAGTGCRILDTRKTLPGLRLAQKYAVRCGGGTNHRVGLFDAILIKENHIAAAGGIAAAIARARQTSPGVPVEVEVESLAELEQALASAVERVLLDNFSLADLRAAVATNRGGHGQRCELEASGNVTLETIRDIAGTGVDFISVGALTKHLRAIDLSMRFDG